MWVVIHGKSSGQMEQLWGLGGVPQKCPVPEGWLCLGTSGPAVSAGAHGFPTTSKAHGPSPTDLPGLLPGSWTSWSLQWLLGCRHFPPDHVALHHRAPHHRATEPCWSRDTCHFFEHPGQVKAAR